MVTADAASLTQALVEPILRDLALRCLDVDGGARPRDPKHRWAMKGARLDHGHQNPFDDLAYLLGDLGILNDETYPAVLVGAGDLADHFTTPDGSRRLTRFAADSNRMDRLITGFAKLAGWYWAPPYPLGPEPFSPEIQRSPALEALRAAGYIDEVDGVMAWSNRFGALIIQHAAEDYGWTPDL